MSYIVSFLVYFILLMSIIAYAPFYDVFNGRRFLAMLLFAFKALVGIFFLLVYTKYYSTGDAINFFKDGLKLSELAHYNFEMFVKIMFNQSLHADQTVKFLQTLEKWYLPNDMNAYNDSRVMIKLNALLAFVSFQNILVHSLVFNFLSFSGVIAIYKSFKTIINRNSERLLLILFFLPSFLFWTSGMLKENIVVAALGFFLLIIIKMYYRLPLKFYHYLVLVLSVFVLTTVKVYILLALVPSFLLMLWYKKDKKQILQKLLIIFIGLFGLSMLVAKLFPRYDILAIIAHKQNDFVNFSTYLEAGSQFTFKYLDARLLTYLQHLPEALLNVIFRPFPFERLNLLTLLSSFENILYLAYLGFIVHQSNFKHHNLFWFYFFFSFTFISLLLIGFSTPLSGALVRYRSIIQPFLLGAFFVINKRHI